jgi:uncharacterized YigZ family protein
MILFRTIQQEGSAEQVIDRSRFIAFARPVSSKEEADAFFAEIRERYKDATHVVPAFIVGRKKELEWASDAGEPQGTSGPPILAMLEKEDLTNVAVAVVRYFGGRLLGTGGLVRAYSSTAKMAVGDAGIADASERVSFTASFAYTALGKLRNREKEGAFAMRDPAYAEDVTVTVETTPEDEETVRGILTETTAGNVRFGPAERTVGLVPISPDFTEKR